MSVKAIPNNYTSILKVDNDKGQSNLSLALEHFFDCYDHAEAREILWNWMSEAVTSHRCIADDPLKRKDSISFYENIITVIDALYLNKETLCSNDKKVKTKKKKHR